MRPAIVGTSCLVAVAGYLVGAALLACVEQERRLDAIGSRAVARDEELEAQLRALGYLQ